MPSQDWHFRSKLNTRCLGIDVPKTGTFYCYLWTEIDGAKSANEVISAFQDMLVRDKITSRYAIISTDNSRSEFKNNLFQFYLQHLIDNGTFERIDYKTLVEGHTYSSADRCFGVIEREASRKDVIEVPSEFICLIEQSSIKRNFVARMLTFKDIYNYKSYLKNEFTNRFCDTDAETFLYGNSYFFNYGIGERPHNGVVKLFSHPKTAWIRQSLDPRETPREISFQKIKQRRDLSKCELQLVRTELKPLSKKVYCDINEMAVKYLSPQSQRWYSELPCESVDDPYEFTFQDY